jgi:hypothetical protein
VRTVVARSIQAGKFFTPEKTRGALLNVATPRLCKGSRQT